MLFKVADNDSGDKISKKQNGRPNMADVFFNPFNIVEILYPGLFKVADYEYEVKIAKTKWRTQYGGNSVFWGFRDR